MARHLSGVYISNLFNDLDFYFVPNIVPFFNEHANNLKFMPQILEFTKRVFFQGASSGRSEGGLRLNRLWTLSAPGAGKGLFRPRMHPAPITILLTLSIPPGESKLSVCVQ